MTWAVCVFFKNYSGLIIAIIIIIIIAIPGIMLLMALRKNKRKVQIKPKFKIIDTSNDIDDNILQVLPDAVEIGSAIVKKFKESKK